MDPLTEFFREFVNFHTVSAFFTALVLGGMVFFMVVTTPAIFKSLEGAERTRYLTVLFPRYYRYMALICLPAGAFIWYRTEAKWLWAMAAVFLFCDLVLRPLIDRNRDRRDRGDEVGARKFRLLHRLSVLINMAQLIVVLAIFFRLAI